MCGFCMPWAFGFLRTYNVQLPHASNLVEAIRELKQENARFEMYLMLGAWMDCVGAWTDAPNHAEQDFAANQVEIERAVALAQEFPDIVKVIAVGNESMVRWATSYFVEANVILHWVNHLQALKETGELPRDVVDHELRKFCGVGRKPGVSQRRSRGVGSGGGLRFHAHVSLPRHPLQSHVLEGDDAHSAEDSASEMG